MKERGIVLSSRLKAREVFHIVQQENYNIVFDFSWVTLINSSFADELFGKIIEQWKRNFKITNIEDPFIKRMITFAMNGRKKDMCLA